MSMAKRIQRLHLVLASAVVLLLLSMTISGFYLAWESAMCHAENPMKIHIREGHNVGAFLSRLNRSFESVAELEVTPCGDVVVTGMPNDNEFGTWVVDPELGEALREAPKRPALSRFMLTLHRSLFLDWPGRMLAGLSSVLTLCLAMAGVGLWFALYGFKIRPIGRLHSDLGLLVAIPLMLLVGSGVVLSAVRFDVWELQQSALNAVEAGNSDTITSLAEWDFFRTIDLQDLEVLRYPFFVDEHEVVELTLQSGERFEFRATDGAIVAHSDLSIEERIFAWTDRIHTARLDGWLAMLWMASSAALLALVYSGFRSFFKRYLSARRMAQHESNLADVDVCIVVSSQTGSTADRAARLAVAWGTKGVKCTVVDFGSFRPHPNMNRCLFLLATYGQGDSPNHHQPWREWVDSYEGKLIGHLAIIAFGDKSYPKFAAFGDDMFEALTQLHSPKSVCYCGKVDRQDDEDFVQALTVLERQWDISAPEMGGTTSESGDLLFQVVDSQKANGLAWIVLERAEKDVQAPIVESGDLLGIVPQGSSGLRFYSLSKLKAGRIGILVKRHDHGVCSDQLHKLGKGDKVSASIHHNSHFRMPSDRPLTFVANGSGMGPFVGMIQELGDGAGAELFWGVQTEAQFKLISEELELAERRGALKAVHRVFSRESTGESIHVQDAVAFWAELSSFVQNKGTWMVCGSNAMSEGLTDVVSHRTGKAREELLASGCWIVDCY